MTERDRQVGALVLDGGAVQFRHDRVEHHLLFAVAIDSHRPFFVASVSVPDRERGETGLMRDQVELEGIDHLDVGNLRVGDRDARDAALKIDYLGGVHHERYGVRRQIVLSSGDSLTKVARS